MGALRNFSLPNAERDFKRRVVEPELDMARARPRTSLAGGLLELIRWLMPGSRAVAGSPRRSVGRELEEIWPVNER